MKAGIVELTAPTPVMTDEFTRSSPSKHEAWRQFGVNN